MDINVVDETNYQGFVELLKKMYILKFLILLKSIISLYLEMQCGQTNVR